MDDVVQSSHGESRSRSGGGRADKRHARGAKGRLIDLSPQDVDQL